MPERPERRPQAKKFTIDISEGWDLPSLAEIIKEELHKMPFYRPGLLYSGFDGKVGRSEGSVFCAQEEDLGGDDPSNEDPLGFALEVKSPALAVYDPTQMRSLTDTSALNEYKYEILSPSALMATIPFKGKKD